jgi:hypothetical protein
VRSGRPFPGFKAVVSNGNVLIFGVEGFVGAALLPVLAALTNSWLCWGPSARNYYSFTTVGHFSTESRLVSELESPRRLLRTLRKSWCREGESNPQGTKYRRILSPLRLPVPPSRLGKIFLLYGSANRFEHGLDWLYLSHRRSDLG